MTLHDCRAMVVKVDTVYHRFRLPVPRFVVAKALAMVPCAAPEWLGCDGTPENNLGGGQSATLKMMPRRQQKCGADEAKPRRQPCPEPVNARPA